MKTSLTDCLPVECLFLSLANTFSLCLTSLTLTMHRRLAATPSIDQKIRNVCSHLIIASPLRQICFLTLGNTNKIDFSLGCGGKEKVAQKGKYKT